MTDSTPFIPADDSARDLTLVHSDDASLPHIVVVGDIYTVLVSGVDTLGRHCLIYMMIPPGGGPAPHRHGYEEMFTILEGELTLTFRGKTTMVGVGATLNIPANAPHLFRNASEGLVRLLYLCAPAGQEGFFAAIGQPVASRTSLAPKLDEAALKAFAEKGAALAPSLESQISERRERCSS